jgi:acylphosphatase
MYKMKLNIRFIYVFLVTTILVGTLIITGCSSESVTSTFTVSTTVTEAGPTQTVTSTAPAITVTQTAPPTTITTAAAQVVATATMTETIPAETTTVNTAATVTETSNATITLQCCESFHAIVSGQVQGVSYRDFTVDWASSLNLTGWVQNLPNGTVEVYAEGETSKLLALIEKLEDGPPAAIVNNLDITWAECTGEYTGFTRLN